MESLTLGLLAVLVLEPLLVVVVAPRVTRRMVERDVDAIIDEKLAPAVKEAATAALEEHRDAMVDDAGAELGRRGVQTRERYKLNEENLRAACVQKFGPEGIALFELAREHFPSHYKVAVRAGPEAVEPFLKKLATMASGGNGQQQAVAYL